MGQMEETKPADMKTNLLAGLQKSEDTNGNPDTSTIKKRLETSLLAKFKKTKTIPKESIYNCNTRKVETFKLNGDSNAMGFAVYLKKEFLGMDFSDSQRSDVLMNSIIV